MMLKNKKWFVIGLIGVLAVAAGIFAFGLTGTASAAGLVESGLFHGRSPGDMPARTPAGNPGGEAGLGEDEYLAEALGLSIEDLQAAYEAAQSAALEQAVEAGLLTQQQADAMAERGIFGRRGLRLAEGEIDFEALLAEALDISVAELQAAKEAAQAARLEQAVADGKLTEEEAALITAGQALHNYREKDELLAKALGISVAELQAAKDEGVRIPELLAELGLAEADFQANLQAAQEEMLQQAVADGVLTQEQADLLLEQGFDGHQAPGMPGRGGHPERGGDFPGRTSPDGSDCPQPSAEVNEN